MFYSHTILTKKGKLGIIWLAATYDGSRRFLSPRDFRKVNIIKACFQIMNPQIPFALRLSSTLLVGVVRVYLEQTRIVLVEARDVIKAVKGVYGTRSEAALQMSPAELREEAVTLPLLLDYEMDFPECQEEVISEHVFAFAKSDRYFRLPLPVSPLLSLPSPVSTPERILSPGGVPEVLRSPFQAEPKDITIAEIDYAKLSLQIIEIPGEVDIDGEPMFLGLEPFPTGDPSLEAKRRDTEEEAASPLGLSPAMVRIGDDNAGVILFDEATGTFHPTEEPVLTTPTTRLQEILPQFATPDVAIEDLEPIAPVTPRKRKLAIDHNIKLSGNEMRNNFKLADRFKKTKVVDVSRIQSAKDLFALPSCQAVQTPYFLAIWKDNAVTTKVDFADLPWTVDVPMETSPAARRELELPRGEEVADESGEEGLSGIELLRAAPADEASSLFEQSAGISFTPDQPSVSRRRDLSLSGEMKKEDIAVPLPILARRASSLARTAALSPIVDVEHLEDDFLPLEDIEEKLSLLSEAEEDREQPDRAALQTLSAIRRAMGEDMSVQLEEVLPLTTARKVAAKAFYHMLALTRCGIIDLDQRRPYDDIMIRRGRSF